MFFIFIKGVIGEDGIIASDAEVDLREAFEEDWVSVATDAEHR